MEGAPKGAQKMIARKIGSPGELIQVQGLCVLYINALARTL
jgi:hypothetical protein